MNRAGQSSPADRFAGWMRLDALPVWASLGHDGPGLGFCESMTLAGRPSGAAFKRMRVQARQIYVFSHAHVLGWTGGAGQAADAYAFITRHGLRDDGAWVRRMGRAGGVLDPAADLYEMAFVLLALAWYGRASGARAPFAQARRTLAWIRTHMAAPGGGYHSAAPVEPGPRQQNPHMHLLEALLALHDATGEDEYAAEALALLALFRRRFLDPVSGALGEFFTPDWQPAPGAEGALVEPGHLYEWVWLLEQCRTRLGADTAEEQRALYRFAQTHGRQGQAVVDAVSRDGALLRASSRLWPQTEAIRAHAVMGAWHDADAGLQHLATSHLADCPRGMWREHFAADGRLISGGIPASSLYHLFTTYAGLAAG